MPPSAQFSVAISTKQPPEPKVGDIEACLDTMPPLGPSGAEMPMPDLETPEFNLRAFNSIMEAAGAELSQTLNELQAQHNRLQEEAIDQALSGASSRFAELMSVPPVAPRRTSTSSKQSNGTSWVVNAAKGTTLSPRIVDTFLPNGTKFRTVEPPSMESAEASKRAELMKESSDLAKASLPLLDLSVLGSSQPITQADPVWHLQQEVMAAGMVDGRDSDDDSVASTAAEDTADGAGGAVPSTAKGGDKDSSVRTRMTASSVVHHWAFELAASLLLSLNALVVGVDAAAASPGDSSAEHLYALKGLFLMVFLLEISLRVASEGKAVVRCRWVMLDALLLLGGLVNFIANSSSVLRNIMVLRLVRLLHLPSVLINSEKCRSLRLVTEGFLASFSPLLWTAVLFTGWLYIYAVFGVALIRPTTSFGDEYQAVAEGSFGSLGGAMLALLSAATPEGISLVYAPLIMARPLLALYFGSFLLIASGAVTTVAMSVMVDVVGRLAKAGESSTRGQTGVERSSGIKPAQSKQKQAL